MAIKVLPDAFASDPERLARFEREAKTLASLNHPHIAAIYAIERSAGVTALVMELVEGDDLSQRIARGAMPIDEALPIAKQIAEALEAAHEQGIIHRDLKPANIKVRSDGTVKVLDFGLAKALEPATGSRQPADGPIANSPTITSPAMTQAGMILGTAAYMAPEQARGKAVDKRADVWAFGAVLFEMLTGKRAFPDGRRVVVDRTVQGNRDLWLLDGARTSRFTFDAAADNRAMWSPDGSRIVFASGRTGAGDLYQKLASGAGAEERLVASDELKNPTSWSADGRFLLYHSTNQQSNIDLWVVPMLGGRTPFVFLRTPFREVYGAFSPDGRWVAYHSNESGRNEIYVRPFVPPAPEASADKLASSREASADKSGGQWQVSTAGGVFPTWRPDGKELYYLNPAGAMMAAPVTSTATSFEPGAPVVLFPTRILGGGADSQQGRQYDVTRDGRFLINTVLDEAAAPITLIQNWTPDAKK